MSARLLERPTLSHVLFDDLESFFHLVLFLSLCLFQTNMSDEHQIIFKKVFAESDYDEGRNAFVGGAGKQLLITHEWYIRDPALSFTDNGALTSWITTARLALKDYYDLGSNADGLALATEELLPDDPLYEAKKAWDRLPVKDHRAMKIAFEEALRQTAWSTAKPGKPPFDRSPRYQKQHSTKQSGGGKTSVDSRTSRQSSALASSSSLQVPGPASGSSLHRRSSRIAAKQPQDGADGSGSAGGG